ncbi:MAG: efflux RND transporter periplasmic adaptor subunit [Planctomycetes bacterium]|nr:efflux RND transporter periplasmic adaptor subunit [Planctomycetota bacterium]
MKKGIIFLAGILLGAAGLFLVVKLWSGQGPSANPAKGVGQSTHAHEEHGDDEHAEGAGHEVENQDAEHEVHGKREGHDEHEGEDGVVELNQEQVSAAGIKVEPVQKRKLADVLQFTGEVRPNEDRLVHVSPRAGGIVAQVLKTLGDDVKEGETLAVLDSAEVGEAALEYLSARNGHELAQADLERQKLITTNIHQMLAILAQNQSSAKAQELMKDLKVGQAKAEVLGALTQRELAQVKLTNAQRLLEYRDPIYKGTLRMLEILKDGLTAEEARAKLQDLSVGEVKKDILGALAELELATASIKREEELLKQQVGTPKAFQEAQRDLFAAASTYKALLEQVGLTAEQEYLQAQQESLAARQEFLAAETLYPALLEQATFSADIELLGREKAFKLAEHQLKIAEDKLHVLGLSHEEIDRLVAGAEERITQLPITAPFNGRIIERHIVLGEKVEPGGEPLYAIADLSEVWVLVDIYEKDLGVVQPGAAAEVFTKAHPEKPFPGTLKYLSDQLIPETRTAKGRVVVSNSDRRLKPGMFARGTLALESGTEALSVPVSALQTEGNTSVVFAQEGEEGRFVRRPVRLGRQVGGYAEIVAGLKEGESVVTEGAFSLKSEMMKGAFGHAGHGH